MSVFDKLNRYQTRDGIVYCPAGDAEYWRAIWLLDSSWLDMDDEDIISELGLYPHYSGPGCSFSHGPWIERSNHSVKVTMTGGLDI